MASTMSGITALCGMRPAAALHQRYCEMISSDAIDRKPDSDNDADKVVGHADSVTEAVPDTETEADYLWDKIDAEKAAEEDFVVHEDSGEGDSTENPDPVSLFEPETKQPLADNAAQDHKSALDNYVSKQSQKEADATGNLVIVRKVSRRLPDGEISDFFCCLPSSLAILLVMRWMASLAQNRF